MPTRKLFLLALVTGAAALAALPQSLVKPIGISALPERPGRVYAMGLAPVTAGDAQAVTQASQNARAEVLAVYPQRQHLDPATEALASGDGRRLTAARIQRSGPSQREPLVLGERWRIALVEVLRGVDDGGDLTRDSEPLVRGHAERFLVQIQQVWLEPRHHRAQLIRGDVSVPVDVAGASHP